MSTEREPFNPLDKIHLAENIARVLTEQSLQDLPPESFPGAGIYAIYYKGPFPAYQPISDGDFLEPIYVGSALPEGGRTGGAGLLEKTTKKLYQRLRQHAKSIEAVENLDIRDFKVRYLLLDDVWIPLAESYLINVHRPVWNSSAVDGFGIHAPGKGRSGQKRSLWDELHPGRKHAAGRPGARLAASEILEEINGYWRGLDSKD